GARSCPLCARVSGEVGDPQRLARLPHSAHQADTRPVDDFARTLEELLDRRILAPPGLVYAQYAGFAVRAEVSAALPALRFAYGADRRRRCSRDTHGLGNRVRNRVLQVLQLLRALGVSDVLGGATIAPETAFVVDNRLPAGADVPHTALRIPALEE